MALKSGRVGIHPSQVDPITGMLLTSPGGASDLSDLDDVSIDNPEAGQLLIYDGDKWENQFASISPTTLASLHDVRIDTPEAGQQLIYDGNKWENQFASISPISLAQLRDVEITDLQDGDFITYDSTSEKWVNTGEAPAPTYTDLTATIYGAVEDTISFTDAAGISHTEVFASGQSSKSVTFKINPSGSTSITFTSAVAKNPDSLSDAYSKTVTITNATTEVWLMPSSDKVLYWYGFISSNLENCSSANGWTAYATYVNPTYNKNDVNLYASGASSSCSIGTKNKVTATSLHVIVKKLSGASSGANIGIGVAAKEATGANATYKVETESSSDAYLHTSFGSVESYSYAIAVNQRQIQISAYWYE